MDDWASFEDGFSRHVHNLGYVPPEFRRHGMLHPDSPPVASLPTRTPTTNEGMRSLMSMEEWWAIENAAELSHRIRSGNSSVAEFARERGGYGSLGAENFIIPDQRPLLDADN